jgi:hypothetical protein
VDPAGRECGLGFGAWRSRRRGGSRAPPWPRARRPGCSGSAAASESVGREREVEEAR